MNATFDATVSRMMQSVMSAPSIAVELDKFRAVRRRTLEILASVTQDQAAWSPRGGVWSMLQIADHLLRSEELYREQFIRLIEMAREGKKTTINISLREVDASFSIIPREIVPIFEIPFRMISMFVPSVVRETIIRYPLVSAINPKVSDPRPGLNVETLREQMALGIDVTAAVFTPPLPKNLDEMKISHPILGNNNVVNILRIITAHEERHHGQMNNLRTQAGFPRVPTSF